DYPRVPGLHDVIGLGGFADGVRELLLYLRSVPAGATRPNQIDVSKSGMPASAMVGVSGKAEGRFAVAEASSLSLPAATCDPMVDAGENIMVTRPAIRSVTACGLPV